MKSREKNTNAEASYTDGNNRSRSVYRDKAREYKTGAKPGERATPGPKRKGSPEQSANSILNNKK